MRYIMFLGFPDGRKYNGTHKTLRGWAPGEIRTLETRKGQNGKGEEVITFNADATADQLIRDFGPDADTFKYLGARKAAQLGFRELSKAQYTKAMKAPAPKSDQGDS